jgi:hypothetical protein
VLSVYAQVTAFWDWTHCDGNSATATPEPGKTASPPAVEPTAAAIPRSRTFDTDPLRSPSPVAHRPGERVPRFDCNRANDAGMKSPPSDPNPGGRRPGRRCRDRRRTRWRPRGPGDRA